jgi:hypothetical protein
MHKLMLALAARMLAACGGGGGTQSAAPFRDCPDTQPEGQGYDRAG